MNQTAMARIAAAISHLRTDWPAASIHTLISKHLADRPARDVAVALTWVAVDETSKTPARVLENGPWWVATRADGTAPTPDNSLGRKCPRCPAWTIPGDGHQCTPAEPTDEYVAARAALRDGSPAAPDPAEDAT